MKSKLVLLSLLTLLASNSSFAEETQLNEARSVAAQLPPKLKSVLEQEIADKGHIGAISTCRDKAPEAAKKISAETGWKIKRVSLQTRNAQRASPDEWEQKVLTQFDEAAAAGENPATLEAYIEMNDEFRYMRALSVQPLCLSCHGKKEVSEEVRAAINEAYPEDQATGYSVGQIRGAISIRKPISAQ